MHLVNSVQEKLFQWKVNPGSTSSRNGKTKKTVHLYIHSPSSTMKRARIPFQLCKRLNLVVLDGPYCERRSKLCSVSGSYNACFNPFTLYLMFSFFLFFLLHAVVIIRTRLSLAWTVLHFGSVSYAQELNNASTEDIDVESVSRLSCARSSPIDEEAKCSSSLTKLIRGSAVAVIAPRRRTNNPPRSFIRRKENSNWVHVLYLLLSKVHICMKLEDKLTWLC